MTPEAARSIRRQLAPAPPDAEGAAALRLLAAALPEGGDLSRVSDHEVLAMLHAAWLSGRLPLEPQALRLMALVSAAPPASTAPPPPAPAPSPARSSSAAPPPAAATTFGADLDVAAQVAALVRAAQQGVPFCEECARAAAAAASGA